MLLGYGQVQFAAYVWTAGYSQTYDVFNIHKLNKVKLNKDNRTYLLLVI